MGDWESSLGWRYVRFRDPPYAEADLRDLAGRLRPLLDSGLEVYGFFRHEDEPTAPLAALCGCWSSSPDATRAPCRQDALAVR